VDEVHLLRDVGGAELAELLADPDEHDGGREPLGVVRRAPGGGVAAVGAAGDPDPVAIDQPLVDQVVDAVDEVVEFLLGVPALAEHRELDAPPGRAPVVLEEHEVALSRRGLGGQAVAG
jgi:hypothetical protein